MSKTTSGGVDIFTLHNVHVHPNITKHLARNSYVLQQPQDNLRMVIVSLAMSNPLWRFTLNDTTALGVASGFTVTDVNTGEELGKIGRVYYRDSYKIAVSNRRIANTKERVSAYRTGDVNKAVATVKKMFFCVPPSERVAEAELEAANVMNALGNNKRRDHQRVAVPVGLAAQEFILGTGFPLFLAYVNGLPKAQRVHILNNVEERDVLTAEMMTIEAVRKTFAADEATLVVKDDGRYLVRAGGDVQLYDDATLPEHIRGKLGMLKLVGAEHFISDVGCRISDEIFVVIT